MALSSAVLAAVACAPQGGAARATGETIVPGKAGEASKANRADRADRPRAAAARTTQGQKTMLYVGTYAKENQPGIHLFEMDPESGKLTAKGTASGVANPSFLAIHPDKKTLYAACETYGPDGGQAAAFAIAPDTGALTLLNIETVKGGGPCYVSVTPSGKYALFANYGGGSVSCLPIGEDGKLGAMTGFVQHKGSSVNQERQKEPHAHSINPDPSGTFAIAADLGTDKLYVYKIDAGSGELTPNEPAAAGATPGAGPRHLAFHPGGKFAYAINELDNTITLYHWDGARGSLTAQQSVGTLPADFDSWNSTAEVVVHPSGRFVYGSNRGHNSIVIFSVDPASGKLTLVGHEPTKGKMPRNFTISPDGGYLLVANQDSDTVVVFRIDKESGKLKATGHTATVEKPVCLRFR